MNKKTSLLIFLFFFALFGVTEIQQAAQAANTVSPIGTVPYNLAGSGVSSSGTSFNLTSFTITQNDYPIQDSDMSETFWVTFEPGSKTRQEFASCTTVGTNTGGTVTISGCTRGLSPIYPYTASSSLKFAHGGGTQVIIDPNSPQQFLQAAMKANNETITGQWTFDQFPVTASTSLASATTSGDVELATGAEAAASTVFGGTGSRLALPAEIATSTYNSATAGNKVVVTGSDGKIDGNFSQASTTFHGLRTWATSTTGTTTFTVPVGVSKIFVQAWGAGEGGDSGGDTGRSDTSSAGQGGGYRHGTFDVTPGLQFTIFVGAGGAKGSAPGNGQAPNVGLPGQNTTIGTSTNLYMIVAQGGDGTGTTTGSGGDFGIAGHLGGSYTGAADDTVDSYSIHAGGIGAMGGPSGGRNGSTGVNGGGDGSDGRDGMVIIHY